MSIDQIFQTKNNKLVEIVEGNLPNKMVKTFLDSLDEWGKSKFRHEPDSENEYQYFALDPMGGRANKIVAYGSVYPKDHPEEVCLAIALDKEWRGCGLGKLMYRLAADVAAGHDKKFFRAETDADNTQALRIMRSLGWEVYGPIYIVKKFFEEVQ